MLKVKKVVVVSLLLLFLPETVFLYELFMIGQVFVDDIVEIDSSETIFKTFPAYMIVESNRTVFEFGRAFVRLQINNKLPLIVFEIQLS